MPNLTNQIDALLAKADLQPSTNGVTVQQLQGGRNNRVYCVQTGGQKFFCKHYFRSPSDKRDRQGAEWAFLQFCKANGIVHVPQPLVKDDDSGLSLFSWSDGRKGAANDVSLPFVMDRICSFLRDLRMAWAHAADPDLPPASDSCLGLADHLVLAQRKVTTAYQNMLKLEESPCVRQAKKFMENSLLPKLTRTLDQVSAAFNGQGSTWQTPLAWQFPSPSDFGLHNALIDNETICFVDFEYAGRDSSIKLLCDTLCQPDNPLPLQALSRLVGSVLAEGESASQLLYHTTLLLPLHRLKWCAILLNEFDEHALQRRQFALQSDIAATQERQLARCSQYFTTHFAG